MELEFYENQPGLDWDSLTSQPGSQTGFEQSLFWAQIMRELYRATPLFFVVRAGKTIIASLMCLHRSYGQGARATLRQRAHHILTGSNSWLEWKGGPTYYSKEQDSRNEATEIILAKLDDYSRNHKVFQISGIAPVRQHHESNSIYRKRGYNVDAWGTFLVDLTRDDHDVWKGLKPSARKGINKSERLGLRLRQIESVQELQSEYYIPYRKFELGFGRKPAAWANFETTWILDEKKQYSWFTAASPSGEVMAVLGIYCFNGMAVEIASSLHPRAYAEKIPAQDFLHWKVILAAKQQGCHTFDLAGVDPSPQDPKSRGIRQFKEKWGGDYHESPRFKKVYRNFPLARSPR